MNISKAICPNCGKIMSITKAECKSCGISLTGNFVLPQLAQLTKDEQNFIVAFIKVHGSIKKMEDILDISYPTVKNKLNELADKLELDLTVNHAQVTKKTSKIENTNCIGRIISNSISVDKQINSTSGHDNPAKTQQNLNALNALGKGEISIDETIEKLKGRE